MTEAWLSLLIGIAISAASALLLWYCAKQCRQAQPPSRWSSEGVATALSLGLVGFLVVGGAWTIKGAMLLVPDAIVGLVVGFVVVLIAMFVTLRVLGPLPIVGSPPEAPAAGKPNLQNAGKLDRT